MNHYFVYNPDVKSHIRYINFNIKGLNITLKTDNNVFSNTKLDEGTRILIEVLSDSHLKGTLLDLGCGYGPVGICLKLLYKDLSVTMSDINELCVALTKDNLKANHINDVNCYVSDSFLNIDNHFDSIAFNPPISCGKEIIYKMYRESYEHLNQNGRLFIVIRRDKGALSHQQYLSSLFSRTSVIYKEKGYYIIECNKDVQNDQKGVLNENI